MRDTYAGATDGELAEAGVLSRLRALADQSSLFPHHGEIELTETTLTLSGWMDLHRGDVRAVRQEYTTEYSRFTAGGARGGFPSLGVVRRRGAPLVLDLRDGRTIVLLVGYSALSGTTQNAQWYEPLRSFIGAA